MVQPIRIAASIRLILAMFRLYAGIEEGFGQSIIDILKKQYPDQKIDVAPGTIGHKLMAIARRQLQNNDDDAMDAIQDFLTYISVGSQFETDADGKPKLDENKKRIKRKDPKSWDFAKDSKTWEEALNKMYRNLKTTAMSGSYSKTNRSKKERSIDDAYGTRGEGGGDPEGGEARMPTPDEGALGKALDDKAAIREFIKLIDNHLPDLRESLTDDTRKLFDLIFEDDVGSFGSDIKENMGQATAMKEKYPELYAKNEKRWSGFIGDLRKKLLGEIQNYVETEMSGQDINKLWDEFFSDTTPQQVSRGEKKKVQEKKDYQRGLDLRKVIRERAKDKAGTLPEKAKKSLTNLEEKLKKELKAEGKDLESVLSTESSKEGPDTGTEEGLEQVAAMVASRSY